MVSRNPTPATSATLPRSFRAALWHLPATLVLASSGTAARAAEETSPEGLAFFEKKVRPLLIEKCQDCHSPEKKIKGGLRLDTKAGWQKGGDSGAALTPHDPEHSIFMKAVSYQDRDLKMPPKQKLSDAEIEVFREWIAMGAPDPRRDEEKATTVAAPGKAHGMSLEEGRKFWAFKLPVLHPAPPVQSPSWPLTDADRFILAKLDTAGLKPAADAPAGTLARRLYFDLTGMPPTLKELAEIQEIMDGPADARMAGYERVVDRLLATPRFGERWGRHWLDISRFAESSGGGRTLPFKDAWRYRDYVIEALNQDMPLQQFITEQLAGDLLPGATPAERRRLLTATGFLVLGPTNYEEQDKQMLRMDVVDEQMDTMGRAFLGMTLSCARCHDHKFDPVPASDYYALAGIFRSTRTLKNYKDNVAHWIDTPLPMEGDIEASLKAHEVRMETATAELALAKKQLKKYAPKVESKDAKNRPVTIDELPGIVIDDASAIVVGDWKASTHYPTFVGEGYVHDMSEGKGEKTLTFTPKLPADGRYEVWFSYTPLQGRADNVPVTILHADGEETVKVDQTATPPVNGRFVSLGQYRFVAKGEGFVLVSNEGTNGVVTADAVVFVPVEEVKKLQVAAARTEADADDGKDQVLTQIKRRVRDLEVELKQMKTSPLVRPEAMTVADDGEPEDCKIHIRGSIRNLGETVPRGFLKVAQHGNVPAIPENESGRRQLAEWVTSDTNPLTARVLVNRVWMWLHGEGLVRTVDNFGTTGETPSHPELLDNLAVEFMQDGWSLKRLVKRMVMGRTYRMASTEVAAGTAVDPDNRLLWRQNRRRMDAESIRDAILSVSGTLEHKLGGPNVLADAVDSNDGGAQNLEYNYVYTDTRRSVYTPAFRNKRLELFDTFDFADINQPIGKRTSSTVAPQALYFMNHPFVIEQSRKGAERLVTTGKADEELIPEIYGEILGRPPTERERQLSQDFVAISASEPDAAARRLESWSLLIQTLFASVDFRYID